MPSTLDAYLNQRMVDNVHGEQSGPCDIFLSSPQSSLPHFPSSCSPAGNTVTDLNLSADNTGKNALSITFQLVTEPYCLHTQPTTIAVKYVSVQVICSSIALLISKIMVYAKSPLHTLFPVTV